MPTAPERLIESHREERTGARVIPFGAEFEPLERTIGYRFRDRGLLEHALTHRSRVHEDASGGVFDNESMEFLGDSILGFVIADMLFREFPQHNEGQKSKLKASIVSATSLARLGDRIDLGAFLILGRGEEKTGGRRKLALIADSYEALIAAIYLDGGIDPARAFIERQFADLIVEARRTRGRGGVHRGLQVGAAGVAAVARSRTAGVSAGGGDRARRTGGSSRSRCWWEGSRWRGRRGRARRKRRRPPRRRPWPSSINLDDAPALLAGRRRGGAPASASAGSVCGSRPMHVAVDFAGDVLV